MGKEDEKPEDKKKDDRMEINAWVYATAEKYEALELKTLALEKFKKSAAALFTNADAMISAVRTVYNNTSLSADDHNLTNVLVEAWILGGEELRGAVGASFRSLSRDVPDFAADVAETFMGGLTGFVHYQCIDCKDECDFKDRASAVRNGRVCSECDSDNIRWLQMRSMVTLYQLC